MFDADAGTRTDYISGPNGALARVKRTLSEDTLTYVHADHLGTGRVGTDAAGAVTWEDFHTPFGESLIHPDETDDQGDFTGHIRDSASGLTYMQARYYDPIAGRFLSIDPVTFLDNGNPAYFNRYAYCSSDPVNCIDPSGENGVGLTDADHERLSQIEVAPPTKEEIKEIGIALLPGSGIASAKSNIEEGNYGMAAFDVATEIPLLKLGKLGKLGKAGCCFVAGTLVDTEDGLRPIEEIKIGDLVLSRNPETGATAYKEVTAFIPRHDRIIWTVGLSGANGASENFETTDEHPWWVAGQVGDVGWKRTDELIAGMFVTTADNQTMKVTSVLETGRLDGTYNITVAEFETYFVGTNKVLVHNCGGLKAGKGNKNFEQDGDAVQFEFDTSSGSATVMGNISQSGGHMVMDQVHTAGSMTAREGLKAANNFAAANGAKSFTVQGGAMRVRGGARPNPIGPIKVKPPK